MVYVTAYYLGVNSGPPSVTSFLYRKYSEVAHLCLWCSLRTFLLLAGVCLSLCKCTIIPFSGQFLLSWPATHSSAVDLCCSILVQVQLGLGWPFSCAPWCCLCHMSQVHVWSSKVAEYGHPKYFITSNLRNILNWGFKTYICKLECFPVLPFACETNSDIPSLPNIFKN